MKTQTLPKREIGLLITVADALELMKMAPDAPKLSPVQNKLIEQIGYQLTDEEYDVIKGSIREADEEKELSKQN